MEETGEHSENRSTAFTVPYSPPRVTWKELSRKSIKIFEDTLIPGELGAVVVRGALSCNSGQTSKTCAVKILKGSAVEVYYRSSNDVYSSGGSSVGQNKLLQLVLGYIYILKCLQSNISLVRFYSFEIHNL